MKRSSLFLALTTGCLAVASFAFAKSYHKTSAVGYCTDDSGFCIVHTQSRPLTITPDGPKATCVINHKTAHTLLPNYKCGRTLYTSPLG